MKRYILSAAALLLLGAGMFGYRWIYSEAKTSVVVKPVQPVNDVLGSETSLKSWQTGQFTTQMPSWLRQTSASDSAHDSLAGSYVVSGGRNKDAQLAVTIASLGNNALSEIPAVSFRNNRPEEYKPAAMPAAPDGALTFYRIGSYERSVFWQYRGHYIAVVASGSSSEQADIQTALDSVLSNWQWSVQ
jgi:hypothetical protein